MVLSDHTIRKSLATGRIVITPLDNQDIQPASVDLHIGTQLREITGEPGDIIDVKKDLAHLTRNLEIPQHEPYLLQPGQFILATTTEWIEIATDIVGRLEGKSSLGRLGLVIHSTAGFIDPGFKGRITLELSNNEKLPITLYRDMKIGQISFLLLTTPAERPYGSPGLGSKYQGQQEPTASRFSTEFTPAGPAPAQGER